jgi:hypothetical protein
MCGPKGVNLNEPEDVGAAVVIRSNITIVRIEPAFIFAVCHSLENNK